MAEMHPLFQFLPLVALLVVTVGIIYAIKLIVEARSRNKLFASNPSHEVIRALLADDARLRRRAALRWGIVLSFLALGFGAIELIGWRDVTPGAVAILLGVTGVGNLVFFLIDGRSPPEQPRGRPPAD